MEFIAKNKKGELARFGLEVDHDNEKSTGNVTASFNCKLPALARAGIGFLKNLDNKQF